MTLMDRARVVFGDLDLSTFAGECHAASLEIVRSEAFADQRARVARGWTPDVGKHSWVALGDPYDEDVFVLDPTLWSYIDAEPTMWFGRASERPHRPRGFGSIWEYGRPVSTTEAYVELEPRTPLSYAARQFLALVEPLDLWAWGCLANSPVGGWPAREIIEAMDDTPRLAALVPIDVLGMLTDRNPGRRYTNDPDTSS